MIVPFKSNSSQFSSERQKNTLSYKAKKNEKCSNVLRVIRSNQVVISDLEDCVKAAHRYQPVVRQQNQYEYFAELEESELG